MKSVRSLNWLITPVTTEDGVMLWDMSIGGLTTDQMDTLLSRVNGNTPGEFTTFAKDVARAAISDAASKGAYTEISVCRK